MSYLTTELLTSLLQGGATANEFLRSKIEEGVNAVLKAELAGFLGYEKHSSAGWHTGNRRNGSYLRQSPPRQRGQGGYPRPTRHYAGWAQGSSRLCHFAI